MPVDIAEFTLFSILTGAVLLSALMLVESQDVTHSIIWFATMLVGIGAFYIFLNAEFIGVIQLIVYAGGVVVLMLFAIMLSGRESAVGYPKSAYVDWRVSIVLAIVLLATLGYFISMSPGSLLGENVAATGKSEDILTALGIYIFTSQDITVLILGLVLLGALLGSVYLVKKEADVA